MSSRDFDPFRLDVAAFATAAGQLEGHWPLAQFDRLVEASASDAPVPDDNGVNWRVRGERRALRGGASQVWLHLAADTALPLECQRCLEPVNAALQIEHSFLFVHGEDAASQLDAESEDDVLALTRALDLRELIEDELLLALPLVPRHEACPEPLPVPIDDPAPEAPPNPFAALAGLKRNGLLN